jgi:hypothetical protein
VAGQRWRCAGDAGTGGNEWVGAGEVGERDAAKESDAYIGNNSISDQSAPPNLSMTAPMEDRHAMDRWTVLLSSTRREGSPKDEGQGCTVVTAYGPYLCRVL